MGNGDQFSNFKFTSYPDVTPKDDLLKSDWPANKGREIKWVDENGIPATKPGIWNGIAYKKDDVSSQAAVDKLRDGNYKEVCQAVFNKNKEARD